MIKKFLILLILLFIPINVFASTNTNIRTDDNMYVYKNIKVSEKNKNDILTTPSVNENEKVYDFASVLSDSFEGNMLDDINEFISNCNIDLFVLTVNDLNGKSIEKYAKDFYNYNNFGKGDKYDCIELIVYNNEIHLYSFGHADNYYDDLNSCIDTSMSDLTMSVVSTINNIDFEYKNNKLSDSNSFASGFTNNEKFITVVIISLIFSGLISSFIVISVIAACHLKLPEHGAKNFLNEKNMKTDMISDRRIY